LKPSEHHGAASEALVAPPAGAWIETHLY